MILIIINNIDNDTKEEAGLRDDTASLVETARSPHPALSLYAAIGPELVNFTLSSPAGELTRRAALRLPARVQYAWPHPVLPILYVACADRSADAIGKPFYLCALVRDANGDLEPLQEPVVLSSRPIHVSTDSKGNHVLTAYSEMPGLTVHRLAADGRIGSPLPTSNTFDMGTNPHQVRVLPGDRHAVLVARGKKGFGTSKHVQGALKVVRFGDGRLENVDSITPDVGVSPGGFNPRHLDFHPTLPFAYVSLEEQNRLCVFRLSDEGILPSPVCQQTTLSRRDAVHERQDCGTVHVDSTGRHVYVANRNDGYLGGHKGPSWLTPDPIPVFPGGENSIALFRIGDDGRPTLVQIEDSRGLHPRTFALDPSGSILVAGNLAPTILRSTGKDVAVPANLAVFSIAPDGRLRFLHRVDLDLGGEMLWWMGIVAR